MADVHNGAAVQARPGLHLLEFRPVRKNSLRGFATVRLANGLINDLGGGETGGRQWALLPSKAMIDRYGELIRDFGGKPRYSPVVDWASREVRDAFSRRVVELIRRADPEAFDQ
jgi:hypothetical protein